MNGSSRALARRLVFAASIAASLITAQYTLAQTTYYVSPTGSDSNSGTSPTSPWQSLTKVDSTSFAPGDNILFQAGGNWYGQQLNITSSGTATAPITISSYGTGANPTFWGSVPVASSAFSPVAGATNTYFYPTATKITSFFVNHQFANSATLASNNYNETSDISYVESTPNTWYYDSTATTPGLYVNVGGALNSSNTYTASVIQGLNPNPQAVVQSLSASNVTFENLNVRESAGFNGGMGFYVSYGSNVKILNSSASATGKHAFAAINTTNFLGENLSASYAMPDQGYGGASAYVSYADYTVANTTSSWVNDTSSNPNGPYQSFYTHATPSTTDPTPIASVLVENLNTYSNGGPGPADSTTGNETVTFIGGHTDNSPIVIYGNNTTIDGMLITGQYGNIQLNANNDIVENTIISGASANWGGSGQAAIANNGANNIMRFNTIALASSAGTSGAAIGIEPSATGTQIYANIFDTPFASIFQQTAGTTGQFTAFDNLFYAGGNTPMVIYLNNPSTTVASLPTAVSFNELFGNPMFVDASNLNYSLDPGSIAAYVFDPTTDEYVMQDFNGNIRPLTLESLGAVQVPEPSTLLTLLAAAGITAVLGARWARLPGVGRERR